MKFKDKVLLENDCSNCDIIMQVIRWILFFLSLKNSEQTSVFILDFQI